MDLVNDNSMSPRQCDVELNGTDGQRTFSVSTTPLAHLDGNPLGQIILFQDISDRVADRHKLETLYEEAELERKRLALTIEASADGIVLLDAQGNVLASNPPAQLLLPARSSAEYPAEVQAVLAKAASSAQLIDAEVEIEGQSFHAAAAPVAGTGLVLTMHDVTHFRQLAGLKDDFVRTVSHDLRTPLTTIRAYAQLAMMSRTPDDTKMDALEQIEESARRMAQLISDLLDLASLEAGVANKAEPVSLVETARTAMLDLAASASSRGLTIDANLEDTPVVMANERLITLVWRNLLDNAIKYTPEGTITLSTEVTEAYVVGRVSDTGSGIAAKDLPYVFDKFYRANNDHGHAVSGTGLGLALVKSIVDQYDGRISVQSKPGDGTSFEFCLPLNLGS
jgi:two-component system sensor histidine kinase ResE